MPNNIIVIIKQEVIYEFEVHHTSMFSVNKKDEAKEIAEYHFQTAIDNSTYSYPSGIKEIGRNKHEVIAMRKECPKEQ